MGYIEAMNDVHPVHGRLLCYYVDSRSGGGQHFVNLDDKDGNGSCTCGDWSCRCVANFKGEHELLTDAVTCHHIRRAHLFNVNVMREISLAQ